MTDEEQIRRVFMDFEDGGLVSKDIEQVLRCVSDHIIGIGIGEQGFVHSKSEIRAIFQSGLREDDHAAYSLEYDRMDILIHDGRFAHACGEVVINRIDNGSVTKSRLWQTLIFLKEQGGWKICGLHASAPAITEENMEAYPLKVAEKLLKSLREEIGEKAFLAESQFQQAVLADTIAFYIVSFSKNRIEKCQVNRELCAYAEPGTLYDKFVKDNIPNYVAAEDREAFLEKLSLESINDAVERGEKEISCEYRLQHPDQPAALWAVTVIRLITDCVTGEQKGIMYVKDIDKQKRREIEMRRSAQRDSMTGLYHKTVFAAEVQRLLSEHLSGALLMLDVDHFKDINDTFGHPFGDAILISAAKILKEQCGENSVIGRLGGDEFAVFAPFMSTRELAECGGRVMKAFSQISVPEHAAFLFSFSIGVSSGEGVTSFEQLYLQADKALYQSKQGGKNRLTILE